MKALLSVSILALALLSSPAWSQNIQYGTDRGGSNIPGANFALPPFGVPENCQGACQNNPNCKAWTFVRSGVQGPNPQCWLKNAVPAPTDNFCCVSGQK